MLAKIIRRILNALMLLWLISMLAFGLTKLMPGDEVADYIQIDERGYTTIENPVVQREAYLKVQHLRGYDLPAFYFTITPSLYSDVIPNSIPLTEKNILRSWIDHSKNPAWAANLHQLTVANLKTACNASPHNSTNISFCLLYNDALNTADPDIILRRAKSIYQEWENDTNRTTSLAEDLKTYITAVEKANEAGENKFTSWMPVIKWNGTANQYHQWMKGLLLQQPLTSLIDGRNTWKKIGEALRWTLLMNGLALCLAIGAGVWIGIWSGRNDGTKREKWIHMLLFALFAVPSFWLATLMIYFLASGEWLQIFPAGGLGAYQRTENWLEKIFILMNHLLMPVLCLALGSLAYVSRQMKQSYLHEKTMPYVTALSLHGIPSKILNKKHIIPNALFPVITMTGGAIPALLSGSLIIEVIFNIPGMGRLMFNSLMARDWPVAFPVLMLSALVTVVAYVLTDVIYKVADPRVKSISS